MHPLARHMHPLALINRNHSAGSKTHYHKKDKNFSFKSCVNYKIPATAPEGTISNLEFKIFWGEQHDNPLPTPPPGPSRGSVATCRKDRHLKFAAPEDHLLFTVTVKHCYVIERLGANVCMLPSTAYASSTT